MNIILDCDGVLLDWESAFRRWAVTKLRRPLPAFPQSWSLASWLKVPGGEAINMIHEFNHGVHFAGLLPIDGAEIATRVLWEMGHTLHVVTSCSRNPDVRKMRSYNLDRYFPGRFSSLTCLNLGESKAETLTGFGPSIWVEDNYHSALHGLEAGHRSFMLRCPHNREWEADSVPEIEWHDDWFSLFESITQIEFSKACVYSLNQSAK